MTTGERIAMWRHYRGITQEAAAGLVGKSLSWWKKVEGGTRTVEKLSDLVLIAQVLRVNDISDLTGQMERALRIDRTRDHPILPRMADAITEASFAGTADELPTLAEMQAKLDALWAIWHSHTHPLATLGDELPEALREASVLYHSADSGAERQRSAALLSEMYLLVSYWARYSAHSDMAWTAADRALMVAHDSGSRVAIALAGWKLSAVAHARGEVERAMALSRRAGELIEPHLPEGSTDLLSVWGHIQLQCGLNAAHLSEEGAAWRHWDSGHAVAQRLGSEYAHRVTVFGQPNVHRFAVFINVGLGHFKRAGAAADKFDMASVPSRALRSWGWIDVARSHAARKEDVGAFQLLTKAHEESPEAVAHSPWAREIITDMLRRDKATVARPLRQLAQQIGMFSS